MSHTFTYLKHFIKKFPRSISSAPWILGSINKDVYRECMSGFSITDKWIRIFYINDDCRNDPYRKRPLTGINLKKIGENNSDEYITAKDVFK